MHFVIMGCGRVGATLAHSLEEHGHTVAVVDQNPEAFRRLGSHFEGTTVTGVGFDRDTLREARVEEAYAFAAVSSGDNSNILAARVARETFGVANVVARIYDPQRAEVYERLGIPTVATVRWTADQMMRRLLPRGAAGEFRDASGSIVIAEVGVHRGWVGRRIADLEAAIGCRVAFLTRLGDGLVPSASTVYQEGDLVHAAMRVDDVARVERLLGAAPQEGQR